MCRLISVFVVRIWHKTASLMMWLNLKTFFSVFPVLQGKQVLCPFLSFFTLFPRTTHSTILSDCDTVKISINHICLVKMDIYVLKPILDLAIYTNVTNLLSISQKHKNMFILTCYCNAPRTDIILGLQLVNQEYSGHLSLFLSLDSFEITGYNPGDGSFTPPLLFVVSFCLSLTNICPASWQNQQNDCAPSEDSDLPGHPPSLLVLSWGGSFV